MPSTGDTLSRGSHGKVTSALSSTQKVAIVKGTVASARKVCLHSKGKAYKMSQFSVTKYFSGGRVEGPHRGQ